jgi:hypothetical protein
LGGFGEVLGSFGRSSEEFRGVLGCLRRFWDDFEDFGGVWRSLEEFVEGFGRFWEDFEDFGGVLGGLEEFWLFKEILGGFGKFGRF